jgi:two-component system, OmpR family, response regulator CpxR
MPTVLAHPTILCLDNEELALSLRKQVLESAGYSVFTATNAIQGLEVFKANSINLVITDHLLGAGTGDGFVTELRQLSPNLPIMRLSGETTLRDAVEPPDYYLHKLEGPKEMINKVRSAILFADGK